MKHIGAKILSLLCLALLFTLVPGAGAYADDPHSHDGIIFTAWESTSSLPTGEGSYYLTGDVTLGDTWNVPSGTTNLCLNGKEVNVRTAPGGAILAGKSIVNVPSGAILNLYDEAGNNGKLAKARNLSEFKDKIGGGVCIDGTLNMYGGKICDNSMIFRNFGAGVYVSGTGTFNMYGGEISNNSAGDSDDDDCYGGGVYVAANGTFTMSGGTICNNLTGNAGGGVYVATNGTFTMSGGTIRDNTAIGDGGGVDNYAGHFAMSGGTITGNTATSGNGGGIIVEGNNVTCSLSGSADISGNHKGSDDNNIYLQSGKQIKVNGQLTNTNPIGVTMQTPGVFTTDSTDALKASDYVDNFVSDNSAYAVQPSGNELTLKMDGTKIEVSYLYYENDAAAIAQKPTTDTQACMKVESSTSAVVWSDDWYVVSEDADIDVANTRIQVNGVVNLILVDGKKLTAKQGIHVGPGATLNIYAQSMDDEAGKLDAIGFSGGAGIGGAANEVGGTITINGGTVTAYGGDYRSGSGAGIGGGSGGGGGTVTINGGTVTATGRIQATGIGGGFRGAGGTVTINGGTVTATGSEDSAGIGGGYRGAGGTVNISGGTVTATGGTGGAGIGGGGYEGGGTVTITGGTVTATGGQYGAGIGGGYRGGGGTVTINGGAVTATGGQNGAGIGAGSGVTNQGTVTLGAGAVVKAGDSDDWDNLPVVSSEDYMSSHTQRRVYIYENPVPIITGADLVLSGSLDFRFYVDVPTGFNGTDAYMTFTIPGRNPETGETGRTVVVPFSAATTSQDSATAGQKIFPCPVYSIEMAKQIEAVFSYGDNQTVSKTASVQDYLNSIPSGSASALVAATKNYGHYMQLYLAELHGFTVGTDDETHTYDYQTMANASEITALTALDGYKTVWNSTPTSVLKAVGYYDTFNETTTLNILFRVADGTGTITATADEVARTVESVDEQGVAFGSNTYRIRIPDIAANNLDHAYHVQLSADGNTFCDMNVSALTYVSTMLANGSPTENEAKALTALYNYNVAVDGYNQ